MLSEEEKLQCRVLLGYVPAEELVSLAETVTARQIMLADSKEAIKAILSFTNDPAELLKRKKIKREYIFQYLVKENVPISAVAEKHVLIRKTLEHWSHPRLKDKENDQPADEPAAPGGGPPTAPTKTVVAAQVDDQQLAVAFASWFYSLLNAQNPAALNLPAAAAARPAGEEFGPQHFYTDCRLSVRTQTATDTSSSSADGGGGNIVSCSGKELVAEQLRALVRNEQVTLNPNLQPSGTRGHSEQHGLSVVTVCGTVHRGDAVLGVFQQKFGLVREPGTDTWKIHFTNLNLGTRSPVGGHLPTLENTRDLVPIES